MDFESPDVERDFPGLYASESGRRSDDSEFSDDSQKVSKKDLLIGKRKDKKDKKDRGYATLEGESSPEEDGDVKSPSKSKKSKAFKFSSKKEKREKSRDKEVKDKDNDKVKDKKKSEDKEKKKDKVKVKLKDKKKSKQDDTLDLEDMPVFGVPLSVATERSKCHDGVDLPLVVRDCIDQVEQHGLNVENVYKISGIKSRVQQVKRMYNQREAVSLADYDLPVATSLLKEFLRDLPEPVFTTELLKKFEEAGSAGFVSVRGKLLRSLVNKLPSCNQTLLAWLVKHFDNIASHEKQNKMNVQCIAVMLSPVLQTSERLVTALLFHAGDLFPDITLEKYVPPVRSADCLSVPDRTEAIEAELKKQESLLEMLHSEMNRGLVTKNREEQLWEVQRIITQLKRRLRSLEKVSGSLNKQSCDDADSSVKLPDNEELNLRLQSASQIQPVQPPTHVQSVQPTNLVVQPVQPASHVQSAQPTAQVQPVQGFSPEQSPLLTDRRLWDSGVSKIETASTDVSPALGKHAPNSSNLTSALKQHAPFVIDEHAVKRHVGDSVCIEQVKESGMLRRQLSLRLEKRPEHRNSLLERSPSFRHDVSSYLSRRPLVKHPPPVDLNFALDRHPLFSDRSKPLPLRSSFRNSVSQGVKVTRQSSFRIDPSSDRVQPVVPPRIPPPMSYMKTDVDGKRSNDSGPVSFPRVSSPVQESRRQSSASIAKSVDLPWRNEPTSLPTNINHFKPIAGESLEVEEINKPSILLLEKKQLAILETEELTNVIINLRALCQLETKEINRIRKKILDLGGNPQTYSTMLSDDSDDEGSSLPLNFERNGILERSKELKWESKRLKHQRDLLLRSICTECEACISLRVQIKLLQMNKSNNQP